MRVAVVQLNTQDKVPENLARVHHWVSQAAAAGAQLVALPENFAFMGEEAQKRELAERVDGAFPGPMLGALSEAAVRHGVWIVGGGMPERSDDRDAPVQHLGARRPEGQGHGDLPQGAPLRRELAGRDVAPRERRDQRGLRASDGRGAWRAASA